MPRRYIALLRAVNVGGTGKLPMADLKRLCIDAGFGHVQTYVASGNVVLECTDKPEELKSQLQRRLAALTGRQIDVFIRTAAEMRAVLEANPFSRAEPARTYAFFLGSKPPPEALKNVRRRSDEEISIGEREIYVYYPTGMGQSRLLIPAAALGTARNMKTVAKLVELSA